MKKVKVVCDDCGGDDCILMDAFAEWDVEKQDWVLQNTFDNSWCRDCDCETNFTYVEIDNGKK